MKIDNKTYVFHREIIKQNIILFKNWKKEKKNASHDEYLGIRKTKIKITINYRLQKHVQMILKANKLLQKLLAITKHVQGENRFSRTF